MFELSTTCRSALACFSVADSSSSTQAEQAKTYGEYKMEEVWKFVEGFEGKYEVSSFGNVRSLDFHHTGQTKNLKPAKNSCGYHLVDLHKDGQKKTFTVHRLVAQAFVPNPGNLSEVNHKNEDKSDNRSTNLEWCDAKYNSNYGTRNERVAKAKSKPVLQYDKSGNFVREWPSTQEVERQNGWDHAHISDCCLGKYKTAYGYVWRYKEMQA